MTAARSGPAEAGVVQLLEQRLASAAIVTEPSAIAEASRVWTARVTARPAVVARHRDTGDVRAAVLAARRLRCRCRLHADP